MEVGRPETNPSAEPDSEYNPSLLDIKDDEERIRLLLQSLDADPAAPPKPLRIIPASKSRYISQFTSSRWETGIIYCFDDIDSEEDEEEEDPQEMKCQSSMKRSSLAETGVLMAEDFKIEDTVGRECTGKQPSKNIETMSQEPPEKPTSEKEEPMAQESPEKPTSEKEYPPWQVQADILSEESTGLVVVDYNLRSREQRKETELITSWYLFERKNHFPNLIDEFRRERENWKKRIDDKVFKRPATPPQKSPKKSSSGSDSDQDSLKSKSSTAGTSTGSKRKAVSSFPEVGDAVKPKASYGSVSDQNGPKSKSSTAGTSTGSKRKAGSSSPEAGDAVKPDEKKKRTSEKN